MASVPLVLLGVSLILFFGFFAEFIFKKFHVPDVLLLIILGFALGPSGFGIIEPSMVVTFAPIFTTFALVFLLYEGAFNIDLASFARGLPAALKVTLFNFFVSVAVIGGVLLLFGFSAQHALLLGFILGGTSSAFVMPLLKQLGTRGQTYSILALESAFTDVLCIVFAFTTVEVIRSNTVSIQGVLGSISALFAVAGLIGIAAGILWILLVRHVFKEHKSYMITIAYLLLVYVATEFLGGNGAIASLFFGIVIKNAHSLKHLLEVVMLDGKAPKRRDGFIVASSMEEFFYGQISFLLKTFFFVYIGLLLDLTDWRIVVIAGAAAIAVMAARHTSRFVTRRLEERDRSLVTAIFARGLAAAAIAQAIVYTDVPLQMELVPIAFAFIGGTILLSSVSVFWWKIRG